MDDEFALCWNNFQDNIATGFQSLFDRGDLVDVTLACEGRLLQAHKIVLAICSPYFQEMLISNPCKHPIIILKDVSYGLMTELLQFMYQGVVNVKHTELASFMKIAQTLQIKGLATTSGYKSPNHVQNSSSNTVKPTDDSNSNTDIQRNNSQPINESKINTPTFFGNKTISDSPSTSANTGQKREFNFDAFSYNPKKMHKRNADSLSVDQDISNESMDELNADDSFLPQIPQISMVESRFDLNNVKRETGEHLTSPGVVRNPLAPPLNFEYNMYAHKNIEYPNDLHMSNDFPKGAGNHMEIPSGINITMLSSTSLLHGNCIFNRNNTVATQQGMKTYWLCKSYRITMCRARCITHQGRVISATGVHNHRPHMKSPSSSNTNTSAPYINPSSTVTGVCSSSNIVGTTAASPYTCQPSIRFSQSSGISQHHLASSQPQNIASHHNSLPIPQGQPSHHQLHHPSSGMQGPNPHTPNNAAVIQNMMQNVFSQNNFMHLTGMSPYQLSQHPTSLGNIHPPSSLQITPVLNSPSSRSNNQTNDALESPNILSSSMASPTENAINDNNCNNHNSGIPAVTSSIVSMSTSSPVDICPSGSQDSNNSTQSNIISSITISPTQPSFKMEHI